MNRFRRDFTLGELGLAVATVLVLIGLLVASLQGGFTASAVRPGDCPACQVLHGQAHGGVGTPEECVSCNRVHWRDHVVDDGRPLHD